MEASQIQNKFKLLFEKIKQPGYVLDNYYADGLINTLVHETEPDILTSKVITQLSELVSEALDDIEKQHMTVRVFLTRLLAIVVQKKTSFTKVLSKKGSDFVTGFKEINSRNMPPSLKVAYMEVALGLISHDSGIDWVMETEAWKEVLSDINEKPTVFLIRQTYKFTSNLVWKLNDIGDVESLQAVLRHILAPMPELEMLKRTARIEEQVGSLSKRIEPMVQMLLAIVTETDRMQKTSTVSEILTKEYSYQYYYVIIDTIRNEHITLLTLKLLFWLKIAKIFHAKPPTPDTVYTMEDFIEITVMYFNTIQTLLPRRSAILILDFCTACHMIWLKVSKGKCIKYDAENVNPQNQMLFLCIVPLIVYTKKLEGGNEMLIEKMKEYILKILNKSCEHTAKAAFSIKYLISQLDPLDIAMQCVKRLTCLKNHLNDEQANIVFQALFFILTEYDPTISQESATSPTDYDDGQEKAVVMTYVLDTVLYLVDNHNINWQESLEVLCLYKVVYNILTHRSNLTCKFVVIALNVIGITIKKFLPPNLSLLMEAKPGSEMHDLGKLIYMKMHDMHWEIRDSALELLLVITDISYIKFPSFQTQILENKLINVTATIAFNDQELYVQASALKCLNVASKIGPIWDQLTAEYPDIQERLISMLRNNQEGIVRKEACSVLCSIYQNIKTTTSFQNILCEHMVSSSLSDFHWEVQLAALRFWRIVIKRLLSDQGMLDGTFPPVTFSKESRKIVTLNENEIQKRLLRILDELSSNGCLTVLHKLLHEDIEVEIIDAALSISNDLISILDQYKVPELLKPDNKDASADDFPKDEAFEIPEDIKFDGGEISNRSDSVIESILNSDDMNLLSNIYDRHMQLKSDTEIDCTPKIKLTSSVTPYTFVNHVKNTNFKNVVEDKKKWKDGIRSLSSLLDDVLGVYEINEEVNTLDCY